jgi:hypothetical protein
VPVYLAGIRGALVALNTASISNPAAPSPNVDGSGLPVFVFGLVDISTVPLSCSVEDEDTYTVFEFSGYDPVTIVGANSDPE